MKNNGVNKFGRWDVGILLSSLLIYGLVMLSPVKTKQYGDGDFHSETKEIASFLWGNSSYENISITKAPGPVIFYLVPYFMAGPNAKEIHYWIASMVWSGFFMAFSLILVRRACVNLGAPAAGKLTVILILILPLHVYYSLGILAEGLAFIGCCFMIYGYSTIVIARKNYWLFILGIMLTVLARPNTIFVIGILIGFNVWFVFRRSSHSYAIAKSAGIALLLLVIISIAIKFLPNKRKTLKQEEYLAHVLVHGRFQFREETFDWRFWGDETREGSTDYQLWKDQLVALRDSIQEGRSNFASVYSQWFVKDVSSHPLVFAKQFVVRLFYGNALQIGSVSREKFSVGGINGNVMYWLFHILINIFNFFILLSAILFITNRKNLLRYWPLVSAVLALWIFNGAIYMEQRYLFPVRPVIIMFAAMYMVELPVVKKWIGRYFTF